MTGPVTEKLEGAERDAGCWREESEHEQRGWRRDFLYLTYLGTDPAKKLGLAGKIPLLRVRSSYAEIP